MEEFRPPKSLPFGDLSRVPAILAALALASAPGVAAQEVAEKPPLDQIQNHRHRYKTRMPSSEGGSEGRRRISTTTIVRIVMAGGMVVIVLQLVLIWLVLRRRRGEDGKKEEAATIGGGAAVARSGETGMTC